MAKDSGENLQACAEVGDHSRTLGLPDRVARLINPAVLAERAERVSTHLANHSLARVHQRRCAEIIANYLLETVKND